MLNRIPFRCSWRVMGHGDGHAPPIGDLLQPPFPSPDARVVAATTVCFHKPVLCFRIAPPTFLRPPGAQGVGHESSRLARRSHYDKACLPLCVINPERHPTADGQASKIMVPDIDRVTPPTASGVFEQPYQLLLLGINADRRVSVLLKASALPSDVPKLPVALRLMRSGQALAIGSQRILLRLQQPAHGASADAKSQALQDLRQVPRRLVRPTQSSNRITRGCAFDQGLQLLHDRRVFFSKSLRPPPGLRMRRAFKPTPPRNSAMPRRTVVRLNPVISATWRMPPWPRRMANNPANKRRCRSSNMDRTRLIAWWSTATPPFG